MKHLVIVTLAAVLSGCGPSPQEEYDTAQRILDREREKLTEAESNLTIYSENSHWLAASAWAEERLPDDLKEIANVFPPAIIGKEDEESRMDLKAAEMLGWKDMRKHADELAKQWKISGMPEKIEREIRDSVPAKRLAEQKSRVERARKALEAAEARLN